MADKKKLSRAEKAVSGAKKSRVSESTEIKSLPGTKAKKPVELPTDDNRLPGRVILAIVSLILCVCFLFMAVRPEGALTMLFQRLIFGIIGRTGFYFSIPALLYIFLITVTGNGQPVRMRCICMFVFVLMSSCIYHLIVNNQTFTGGLVILADLWTGGASGTSGGVLCGLLAMIVRWACGSAIAYFLFILTAILTLLAAMKITVPSIIRAIRNRPREDWEEDLLEDRPEPAERVVNHLANRHIERKRALRERQKIGTEEDILDGVEDPAVFAIPEPVTYPSTQMHQSAEEPEKQKRLFDVESHGQDAPQMADVTIKTAEKPVRESIRKKKAPQPEADIQESSDITAMPEFRADDPIPDGPRIAEKKEEKKTEKPVSPNAKVTSEEATESARQVAEEIARNEETAKPVYSFPPLSLLKKPSGNVADGTQEMRENSRRLNETLESFKIDAHIVNVTRGPSVTRYEVELDKGVRLNKLTTVADDIALSLGAPSVRIAPVPGKISVVGIEVPNRAVTMVNLREVIGSQEFSNSKSRSTFAVGKDIGGSCIVANIAKMPHMLIAGTTGSGKSVCMNSVIISLLYKASPEEVKLIMIDPKMVELGIYNGIPHLMIPVVTDPKKAAGALQWAVTEMMRRYKIMSDSGVRDLESYNSMVDGEEVEGSKMPQIVVIIDELADLMLVAAKEVEDSICRIAQMGRAAGMHLIIATQRPSADVITGLMKANIPSRIAFSVASAMESRIILDTVGAEKLVGKGDMLFAPIGTGKPQRVQGCFVSDPEVEAVATYVKDNFVADYDQQVLKEIEKNAVQTGNKKAATAADSECVDEEPDGDEMLPAAVDVILETGQASVSLLQRRLKLGYARAARIVDEMEEKGYVGPFQGSKPRAILITKEVWEQKKNGGQMDMDDLPFDDTEEISE